MEEMEKLEWSGFELSGDLDWPIETNWCMGIAEKLNELQCDTTIEWKQLSCCVFVNELTWSVSGKCHNLS